MRVRPSTGVRPLCSVPVPLFHSNLHSNCLFVLPIRWIFAATLQSVQLEPCGGGRYSSGAVSSSQRRATGFRPVCNAARIRLEALGEVPSGQILVLVLRPSVPASRLDPMSHQQPAVQSPQPRRMHWRLSPQKRSFRILPQSAQRWSPSARTYHRALATLANAHPCN